jgi:3-dehydroquinate synthase class II
LFIIAVVASLIALASIIITIYLVFKMKRFEKAHLAVQTFMSGAKLEDLLKSNLREMKELSQRVANHDSRLEQVENKLRSGIDCAELIKFNSFDNMGAELSFALALLNQEGTGVVLTGIHSVEESRVYAKAIEKGQSPVKLLQEEKLAIERACCGAKI